VRSAPGAPVTLGITGASGAPYAVRLLRALNETATPLRLVVSSYGWRLLAEESGIDGLDALKAATGDWSRVELYDALDRGATPASGSAASRGMVICPCSMGTLASVAAGTSRNLVERAADVALKERRPLILVTREMPLSLVHRPQSIDDLVDFVVARVLDHLDIEHSVGRRWRSGEKQEPQGTGDGSQGTGNGGA